MMILDRLFSVLFVVGIVVYVAVPKENWNISTDRGWGKALRLLFSPLKFPLFLGPFEQLALILFTYTGIRVATWTMVTGLRTTPLYLFFRNFTYTTPERVPVGYSGLFFLVTSAALIYAFSSRRRRSDGTVHNGYAALLYGAIALFLWLLFVPLWNLS